MKRILAFALCACLCLGLVACGQPSAPTATPSPSASQTPASPSAAPTADENARLDQFIDLINSFSDPPEADDTPGTDPQETMRGYYRQLYEDWKAGNAFPMIIEDAAGNLKIDDRTAEFAGEWRDETSGRATMQIESAQGAYYDITINWANDAWESMRWEMVAYYDARQDALVYDSGQAFEDVYSENSEEPESTLVYEDGSGKFWQKDGKLLWQDEKEDAGKDCAFVRVAKEE